jgi:hypothetical protein
MSFAGRPMSTAVYEIWCSSARLSAATHTSAIAQALPFAVDLDVGATNRSSASKPWALQTTRYRR